VLTSAMPPQKRRLAFLRSLSCRECGNGTNSIMPTARAVRRRASQPPVPSPLSPCRAVSPRTPPDRGSTDITVEPLVSRRVGAPREAKQQACSGSVRMRAARRIPVPCFRKTAGV
jgi:hypothetical protein